MFSITDVSKYCQVLHKLLSGQYPGAGQTMATLSVAVVPTCGLAWWWEREAERRSYC